MAEIKSSFYISWRRFSLGDEDFYRAELFIVKDGKPTYSFVEGRIPATKVKFLKSMMSFAEMAEEILEEDVVNADHD